MFIIKKKGFSKNGQKSTSAIFLCCQQYVCPLVNLTHKAELRMVEWLRGWAPKSEKQLTGSKPGTDRDLLSSQWQNLAQTETFSPLICHSAF